MSNNKELVEIDYIEIVRSENDRRVRHLYLTEKGIPAARRIKEIHSSLYSTLCLGLSSSDIRQTEEALEKMLKNINQKVWHRMEEHHE